jgi:hypothetical protein
MGCNFTAATKFCTVVPNICGFLARSFFHVTLLEPRILRWLPDFFGKVWNPALILLNESKTYEATHKAVFSSMLSLSPFRPQYPSQYNSLDYSA